MSEMIRRLVSGNKMNRRDFLKKAGGGALFAATQGAPVSPQPQGAPLPPAPVTLPGNVHFTAFGPDSMIAIEPNSYQQRSILDRVFDERYGSSQDEDGNFPLGWGGGPELSREDFVRLLQEQNRARKALENAPSLPTDKYDATYGWLRWNPESGEWQRMVTPITREKNPDYKYISGDEGFAPTHIETYGDPIPYVDGMPLANLDVSPIEAIGPEPDFVTLNDVGRAYGHIAPERPKQNARQEPEQQKRIEQFVPDQASGGWHNMGRNPFAADPLSMTDTSPLFDQPPVQSATSGSRARTALGAMALPSLLYATQQQQKEKQSPLQGLIK